MTESSSNSPVLSAKSKIAKAAKRPATRARGPGFESRLTVRRKERQREQQEPGARARGNPDKAIACGDMLRRCPAYGHCDNKQAAEGRSGAPAGPLHQYCDASTKNKHCANPKGGGTWKRFKQTFRDARCNAVGLYDQKWQCSYRSPSGADEQQAEAVIQTSPCLCRSWLAVGSAGLASVPAALAFK